MVLLSRIFWSLVGLLFSNEILGFFGCFRITFVVFRIAFRITFRIIFVVFRVTVCVLGLLLSFRITFLSWDNM